MLFLRLEFDPLRLESCTGFAKFFANFSVVVRGSEETEPALFFRFGDFEPPLEDEDLFLFLACWTALLIQKSSIFQSILQLFFLALKSKVHVRLTRLFQIFTKKIHLFYRVRDVTYGYLRQNKHLKMYLPESSIALSLADEIYVSFLKYI